MSISTRLLLSLALSLTPLTTLMGQESQPPSVRQLLTTIEKQRETIEKLEARIAHLTKNDVAKKVDLKQVKGIVSPKLFASLEKVAREIARREKTGDVKTANEFRSSLGDFTKQVQGGLVNNLGEPELHHVGVYEGMLPGNAKRGFQQHPEGIVEVTLDYTGGPIILALSAYEPVLWKVKLAEGVDLRRVVLAGSKQRVEGLPDRVKVQREHQGRKLG